MQPTIVTCDDKPTAHAVWKQMVKRGFKDAKYGLVAGGQYKVVGYPPSGHGVQRYDDDATSKLWLPRDLKS